MRWLTGIILVFCWTARGQSVVLVAENGSRISGFLVSLDSKEVVIRRPLPDGSIKVERFDRAAVTVLESYKPERLSALQPSNPRSYRDLAEELATKKDDPDARDLAIRLLVISASLDPERLGKGCMISAAAIARNPTEQEGFKCLAYILDPNHDREILKERGAQPATTSTFNGFKNSCKPVASAMKAFRRGQYKEAEKLAKIHGCEQIFALSGKLSQADFLLACANGAKTKGQPDPTTELYKKILRIELDLEDQTKPEAKPALGQVWPLPASLEGRLAPPLLTLETITEFSPAECLFVMGKWARPGNP